MTCRQLTGWILIGRWPGLMAGPFAPSGRRVAARRRTPGGLGPRARPRPRCGLGLVAASVWARPCGRALRPGPRPSPPHTPPARLGTAGGKADGASPAGWWGLPSAPSGRVPPAPSGLRAATPARPGRLGRRPPRPPAAVGVMWRLVAACGGSGLRPCGACQPPAVARGHPSAKQGLAPFGARLRRGLALLLPRAGRGVGAPARPGPHSVGAVGPSAPPARSGLAPASRPALARLRLCPRWCGSACARPARRSGPAPLRRPAAEPRGGVRAPAGRGPCAAAIFTPRARALPALRVAALSRASRAAGARGTPPAGGTATPEHIRQGQDKPPAAGLA